MVRLFEWLIDNSLTMEGYVREHYGEPALEQLNKIIQNILRAAPLDEISVIKR